MGRPRQSPLHRSVSDHDQGPGRLARSPSTRPGIGLSDPTSLLKRRREADYEKSGGSAPTEARFHQPVMVPDDRARWPERCRLHEQSLTSSAARSGTVASAVGPRSAQAAVAASPLAGSDAVAIHDGSQMLALLTGGHDSLDDGSLVGLVDLTGEASSRGADSKLAIGLGPEMSQQQTPCARSGRDFSRFRSRSGASRR